MATSSIPNARINELLTSRFSPGPVPSKAASGGTGAATFGELLQDQLKVSGHAKTRMESRNIALEQGQWDRVVKGVDKASAKGSKESLVMVDDVALVVSVKNRTVITAVDKASMKENVFTNIDSAVIV